MTQTTAKIVADSVSPAGVRLVTFEATFSRIILSEVNTHRMLSRNSASSRAIPVEKMIARVLEDSYVPTHWGKNQRGMQAEQDVDEVSQTLAKNHWLLARDSAVAYAKSLLQDGIHKQITNRLLEPFMWHVALITATEWSNFFHLRDNKDAHPDFRDLAHAMRELYGAHTPKQLGPTDWHLPLVFNEDFEQQILVDPEHPLAVQERLCKISVGRCARVSYLTHEGKRDPQADIELCDRLFVAGHLSPAEHVARPETEEDAHLRLGVAGATVLGTKKHEPMRLVHWFGNLRGWVSYRKLIPHEEDIFGARP